MINTRFKYIAYNRYYEGIHGYDGRYVFFFVRKPTYSRDTMKWETRGAKTDFDKVMVSFICLYGIRLEMYNKILEYQPEDSLHEVDENWNITKV